MSFLRGVKVLIGLLILSLFLGSGLLPSYGDQLSDFKKEQQKIQGQIKEQKKEIQEREAEKRTYMGQLNKLEDEMLGVQNDLKNLQQELKAAESQVKITAQELGVKEIELDERMDVFCERLKEVYINGQVSYLEVAFQATSVSDFLSRFDLLEELVAQDVELLEAIELQINEIEVKKAALEEERNHIQKLKSSAENQERLLLVKQEEKRQWIEKVEEDQKEVEQALDELAKASSQVSEQIRKIQAEQARKSNSSRSGSNSAATFNGVFSWPTPGYTRITSDYGNRLHPILKVRKMHTGIDISAPSGTGINSVADGTVIFAGWMNAYGNTTIVDHGGGISTLYAHQSSISVKVNQSVKQGDNIGRVGSTGWSTGPHLHIEVRKNGDPINLWNYLK